MVTTRYMDELEAMAPFEPPLEEDAVDPRPAA